MVDDGRFCDAAEPTIPDTTLAAPAAALAPSPAASGGADAAAAAPEADEPYEYADDDYGSDDGWDEAWDEMEGGGAGGARLTVAKSEALASRFDSLISLEPLRGTGMSQSAGNSLNRTEKKAAQAKNMGLTRDERATTEHVLDPRTRLLLFKMLNSGVINQINGCVSTGKEANVYHAFGRDCELAIKVCKATLVIRIPSGPLGAPISTQSDPRGALSPLQTGRTCICI